MAQNETRKATSLARELGAVWLRSESVGGSLTVLICFRVAEGPPETYSSCLQWLPLAAVAALKDGWRLGDTFESLGDGLELGAAIVCTSQPPPAACPVDLR